MNTEAPSFARRLHDVDRKPHIRRVDTFAGWTWQCMDGVCGAWGWSPSTAYQSWRIRRDGHTRAAMLGAKT